MAVINRNLQLRDINLNLVFPRASLDNIQRSKNDGRDALIVTLDDTGHISSAYLPDAAESVVMLLAATNTAPTGAVAGDRYYNISQNKIYTYVSSSWTSAVTPDINKLYITKNNGNIYRYDGTSQMIDISTHFNVLQSVANDPTDASVTGVPSEYAVSVALQGKQDRVSGTIPITVSGNGTVSLNYSSGLKVANNNLVSDQNYIVHTVDSLMLCDAGPADQSTAYVNGGTVYTILGNCTITTSVASTGASDTKVPTEAAVRSAVNAAIATGGSTVVPGRAINVTGGSINVTAATTGQVLGSTVSGTARSYIPQNDFSAVTPAGLVNGLSFGRAEDVTERPYVGGGTLAFDVNDYLGKITWTFTTGSSSGSYGFGLWTAHPFTKFITGHTYLYLCDIKNTGSVATTAYNWSGTTVAPGSASLAAGASARLSGYITTNNNFGFYVTTAASTTYALEISNWRIYDVTNVTGGAREYLGLMPNPDVLFRNADINNVDGRYLIKADAVSPYVLLETFPNNTDLTVFPGRAYSHTFTDNNTHIISAATTPANAWCKDAFLQLTVKDASKVTFSGINLMSPLRSNSGNNIIIKFRAGQVNAYVEDTDVGYVVTLNSGSQNGSLAYGLGNNVGNYIVFSDTTNIT